MTTGARYIPSSWWRGIFEIYLIVMATELGRFHYHSIFGQWHVLQVFATYNLANVFITLQVNIVLIVGL